MERFSCENELQQKSIISLYGNITPANNIIEPSEMITVF